MIISRLTTLERDSLSPSPIGGYVIYNIDIDTYQVYSETPPGWVDISIKNEQVVFLDETSTPLDLVDGKTHIYIGNGNLNWDFDVSFPSGTSGVNPFPLGFDLYNLSEFTINAVADGGNSGFGLQRLWFIPTIQSLDTGSGSGFWGLQYANQYPYFSNINELLQVTNQINNNSVFWRETVTNRTLEVAPRYLEIFTPLPTSQSEQFRILSRQIYSRNSNTSSFNLNFPDMGLTTSGTTVDVNFRNNVSGTVAYLSDITSATALTLQQVTNNGNTTTNSIVFTTLNKQNTFNGDGVTVFNTGSNETSGLRQDRLFFNFGAGDINLYPNTLTNSSINLSLPSQSGTIALLSDIPSSTNNIIQNGNSFGANMVIGTNDLFNLSFETNGTTKATFDVTGGLELFNLDSDRYALTVTNAVDDNNYTKWTGSTVEYLIGFQTGRFLVKNNTTNRDIISYNHTTNSLTLGSTASSNQNVINLPNSNVGYTGAAIGLNSGRKFYYTDGTTVRFFVRTTNQLATDTVNYETLVTNNNDFVNKKYVDNFVLTTDREQTHTTGTTVTVNNDVSVLYVNPSATLASLTITLPSTPSNGQEVKVSFGGTLTTGSIVTTLSIVGNTGHTILAGSSIITANAGDGYIFKFQSSINLWRIY